MNKQWNKKQQWNKKLFVLVCLVLFSAGCATTMFVCPDGTTVNDASTCKVEEADEADVTEEDASISSQEIGEAPQEAEQAPTYKAEQTAAPSQKTSVAVTEAETASDGKPVQTEVTDAQKEMLDKALLTNIVAIYPTMMGVNEKIAVGETFTFGVGLTSSAPQERSYNLKLRFVEGKTMSMGRLGADETVLTWFDEYNDLSKVYTLQKGEKMYIPLIVKPGETINENGDKTFAGTYRFELTMAGLEDYSNVVASTEFTVFVK